MLELGVYVNARELRSGRTALDAALALGRADVAEILARRGGVKGGGASRYSNVFLFCL